MFFAKTPQLSPSPSHHVAIIGTSPLAFFLADTLQNNHCAVSILVAANRQETYSRLGSLTVKPSSFQSHHASLSFSTKLDSPVDFAFIASTPQDGLQDLLLLQDSLLKSAPLINLSSFYNHAALKKFKGLKEIRAYFNGWLNLEKNTLQSLERNPLLEFCCDTETAANIKPLFADSPFSLAFPASSATLFWQRLAPFFLGNLLLLAHGSDISSILLQPGIRQRADTAITELCQLAKANKASLDSTDILTRIYAFPDNYQSEFVSPRAFTALQNMIPGIGRFETPAIYSFFAAAAKKY